MYVIRPIVKLSDWGDMYIPLLFDYFRYF